MMSALAAVVLISVIVVVHEWGHFITARLFGVTVHVFSIGFGRRLFGFRYGDTDYRVSEIPVGGYVLMAGADPFGEEDADAEPDVPPENSFLHKPIWQRLIISGAGPGVNVLLPFVLFTGLLMAGRPDAGNEVGMVVAGSAAAEAGVRAGDRIVAFDGAPVRIWRDLEDAIEARVGEARPMEVRLERDEGARTVTLDGAALSVTRAGGADTLDLGLDPIRHASRVGVDDSASPAGRAGMRTGDVVTAVDGTEVHTWQELMSALDAPGPDGAASVEHVVRYWRVEPRQATTEELAASPERVDGEATLRVDPSWAPVPSIWANRWGVAPVFLFAAHIEPGDPAEAAGLQIGDRLHLVDGEPVLGFAWFIERVGRAGEAGTPLHLSVVRDGAVVERDLLPTLRLVEGEPIRRPVIGLGRLDDHLGFASLGSRSYGPLEAMAQAGEETWTLVRGTVASLGNVLTGAVEVHKNVGGPVAMAQIAGTAWDAGIFAFISTIGMVSVGVGMVNLLPVPVLDGGQILFHLIELVRGRPLSLAWRERIQMVSVLLLVVLVVVVTLGDVAEWLGVIG
jgi:regulator of sigma E protease